MASLYEINEQIRELVEKGFNDETIDNETGEIDETKVQELLEQLQIDQSIKFENIACYIKNLESDAKALKVEEQILKTRREQKENKIENLKNYLSMSMQSANLNKLETSRVVLGFRKSESVEIVDEAIVPSEFVIIKTTTMVDKTAIRSALKVGQEISGCTLVEKQNLQIK